MSVLSDLLTASGIGTLQALMLAVFLPFLIPFFYLLYRAPRSSSRPRLRAIPAYDSLKKLMSRAAETGQAVHVSVGTGGVSGPQTADTLAGLNTLEFLADRAANSDIPPLVTVTDPTAFPAALDQLRRAYERQGYPEEYRLDQARYIAPPVNGSAVPYAAGVMDILSHEPITANVMLGSFGDEYLLMTEPAAQDNIFQVGGTSNPSVLPFTYLTMSEPLLGEEIYAAGAYLLERVEHYTSLIAQDVFRVMLVIFIVAVVIAAFAGVVLMEQPRINFGVLLRRQLIPVGIALGVGLVVLLGQFISNSTLDSIVGVLVAWGAIVAAFALLLGLANLGMFHAGRILKRDAQMPFSILILATAIVVFLFVLPSGGAGAASQWVMRYLYQPLEASFLALLVFFIGTAVYRALRIRTWEMALFAISAIVVLVGSVPFMEVVSPLIPAAKEWVVNVPALAGVRGILLGVALGIIATGLRLLTGIDRPYSQ